MANYTTIKELTPLMNLIDKFSDDASQFFFDEQVIHKAKAISYVKRAYKLGARTLKLTDSEIMKIYDYESEFERIKKEDQQKARAHIEAKYDEAELASQEYEELVEEMGYDPYAYEYEDE